MYMMLKIIFQLYLMEKMKNVFLEEKTFYKYEREKDYFVNFSGVFNFEKK